MFPGGRTRGGNTGVSRHSLFQRSSWLVYCNFGSHDIAHFVLNPQGDNLVFTEQEPRKREDCKRPTIAVHSSRNRKFGVTSSIVNKKTCRNLSQISVGFQILSSSFGSLAYRCVANSKYDPNVLIPMDSRFI
jgi:hypothetical protein